MSDTERLKQQLRKKPSEEPVKHQPRLSSGCTLINLSCTDDIHFAYRTGAFYLFVGDSGSAKSWLMMSVLAEASIDPFFDEYALIYFDEESGVLMDIERFFGSKAKMRVDFRKIRYVEDFYDALDDLFDKDQKFIVILDSMDALISRKDEDARERAREARTKGKPEPGTFGMGKPKCNSQNLGRVISKLDDTGSMLFMIAQTRDNIGFGNQYNPKTRSGGNAMKFAATMEFWTSVKEKKKRTVMGRPRQTGIVVQMKVKKNRQVGKDRTIEIPHYWSSGLDDLGSCIDYLITEKHWSGTEAKVIATEFQHSGSIEKLIERIESENREDELRAIVKAVWTEIDQATRVERKSRYT